MEAHVVLGGVGVLAAFGCGAAASASVAGRARRRTASLVGEGDVGSSRVAGCCATGSAGRGRRRVPCWAIARSRRSCARLSAWSMRAG